MGFEGFVRVSNNSGEEYENAQVRLVVGKINLVEKIAQLAKIPVSEVAKMAEEEKQEPAGTGSGRFDGWHRPPYRLLARCPARQSPRRSSRRA